MGRSRGRHRAYNRVSAEAHEVDDSVTTTPTTTTTPNTPLTTEDDDDNNNDGSQAKEASRNEKDHIELVIMDPAHRTFQVSAHPEWTVEEFKERGAKVHKVPATQQRLFYRGRQLQDEDALQDVGVTEPKTIIHLFPRPRVVVSAGNDDAENEQSPIAPDGAHVPRIVLEPEEAERRSSILVLGSAEIIEAQNSVKLLSFLLLIICSMQLMALFTIMVGVPDDETIPDEPTPPPTPAGADDDTEIPMEMRTWRNSDYVDLAISSFGFYVATLGIKATTENTLRLARLYLVGTVIVGIAWNIFNYYLNVQAEREMDQKRVDTASDDKFDELLPASTYYVQAGFAMLLPAMLWFLCCIRAWQFHGLLQEAEEEAEARIRNEISNMEEGAVLSNEGDQELTLQDETARIT